MNAKKLAVAGITVGLVLGLAGITRPGTDKIPAPTPAPQVLDLEPIHGLAPIEEVVRLFQQRSAAQPLDYVSRTQLSAALSSQAKEQADLSGYEAAARAARDALTINPTYIPAKLTLASALHAQHRFGEAREIAQEVAGADPSAGALALVGDSAFEVGDYDEAARAYQELMAIERSAPVVSRLARLAWIRGDNASAVALAEEALGLSERLALRPAGAAFYWFQLGHFRFETGDVDGAIEALERAREIDPANPAATELLAFVHASSGDPQEATQLYEALIQSGPAADLHGSYADLLRRNGHSRAADAQDGLGTALAEETAGRFPAERRHLVGFYLTRDPAAALRLAEEDLKDRQDVSAYDTLAWALHRNGRNDEAHVTIQSALQQGTRSASLLVHAGTIAASVGDTSAARTLLADGLAVNPLFHPTEAPAAAALLAQLGGPLSPTETS